MLVHASESLDARIAGIEGELLDNVSAQPGIAQLARQTAFPALPVTDRPDSEVTEASVCNLHRAATKEIRQALQPFGYYSPAIESTLERVENRWLANYQIDPGEATPIDNIELGIKSNGRDNADLRKVLDSTKLARGQRLPHIHYEETEASSIKAALAAGYLENILAIENSRCCPGRVRCSSAGRSARIWISTGHSTARISTPCYLPLDYFAGVLPVTAKAQGTHWNSTAK